jgi:hypothetical protein
VTSGTGVRAAAKRLSLGARPDRADVENRGGLANGLAERLLLEPAREIKHGDAEIDQAFEVGKGSGNERDAMLIGQAASAACLLAAPPRRGARAWRVPLD